MKRALIFAATFLGLLVSASAQSGRTEMVKQLLALETAILHADKQKVASYFSFPVADEGLKLKVEFDGEKEISLAKLDKPAFLKYYTTIVSTDFIELFKQLDLSVLKTKNSVTKKFVPKSKTDFCYYNYEVVIEGEQVKLHFLLNTRDDIELPEDAFCPEYAEFWTFEMIKGKLQFKEIDFAG